MSKQLKRYGPTILTLLLVALGAAMPWLASLAQDVRIGKLQEDLELNTVSLTLLQDNGLEQTLRIASSAPVTIPWEGGTALTEDEVFQAADEALNEMYSFGLLQKRGMQILSKVGMTAEPCLMVAENGGSALVWNCCWADEDMAFCTITVDDASGKAVQLHLSSLAETGNAPPSQTMGGVTMYSTNSIENCWVLMDVWASFLQYYYNATLVTVTELEYFPDGGANFLLGFEFYDDDTAQTCSLLLEMYPDEVRFNF